MSKEQILEVLLKHYGKIIGVFLGLLVSILVITLGFIKTIFISICVYIGYFFGNKVDKKENIWELLDRILPPGTLK